MTETRRTPLYVESAISAGPPGDQMKNSDAYRRQLTVFHDDLLAHLEGTYKKNVVSLVLKRQPDAVDRLPLAEIRRNIRRMAALLQQQAPDLFIDKRARQRMFPEPSEPPSSDEEDDDHFNINVFISDKLAEERVTPDSPVEPVTEVTFTPKIRTVRTDPSPRFPPVVKHKTPRYDNVRSSLDTKGTPRSKRTERADVVFRGKKPKFNDLGGSYVQEGTFKSNSQTKQFVRSDPFRPKEMDDVPKLPEVRKLPPNPERLKNLVSRDFSKPPPSPRSRPDPKQQLAKPLSPVKKPLDIFKQQKVRMNKSMDNMVSMTNYGEAEKPDPYKSKSKPREEEEKEQPKKPYKLPKELKRALGGQKLPPIAKPKPPPPSPSLDPTPSPLPPHPTPLPQVPLLEEPEMSFVMVKDDNSEEDDDPAVTDSAYCTCEEYTESEDYQSRFTDDGTRSSARLEICSNCGGKRSIRGSRVPSSIKEQSFVLVSRSSSGIFTEEHLSPSPPPVAPRLETPTLSPEDILLDLTPESPPPPPPIDKEPSIDFMKALDEIGQFKGIPDPEPELPPPSPVSRTVLAPIKRQKGVYANGVREAYIKALVAAEVRRLPEEWWMMLGPRISRSWVFSYYQHVPPPSNEPPPPPPTPPPSYLAGTTAEPKKKKKRKKKFKPMKHIFGKIKPDSYFPGMKKNQILAPVTITEGGPSQLPPPAPFRQVLPSLEERPIEREEQSKKRTVATPVRDYRLTRNVSRQSSHHSHNHDSRI